MATKFDRESNHGIVHFLFNKNIQLFQSFFYPGTENLLMKISTILSHNFYIFVINQPRTIIIFMNDYAWYQIVSERCDM